MLASEQQVMLPQIKKRAVKVFSYLSLYTYLLLIFFGLKTDGHY